VKAGTEPLEAVLAKRQVTAAGQLEGEAIGDPLAEAGLQDRLGRSLVNLGHPQDAIPLFLKAREARTAKLGTNHPDTLGSMHSLAGGYWGAGKLELALPLFEETLKLREDKLGADHPDTLWRMNNLLSAYVEAGEKEKNKADALLAEARKHLPKDSSQLARSLALVGLSLLKGKAFSESKSLLRECLTIREKTQPDVWTTFNTQSMLGGALLGQKKYADAKPLLLKGYDGMKQREKTIPLVGATRIPEALDRLIEFYTATDKPDEVKKWQAERANYPAEQALMPRPVE